MVFNESNPLWKDRREYISLWNKSTRQSSIDALRVLDRSLDRIHKERAKLGALMSRMEKAIDNLSNVALNTNASRGRIQDADFAKESARLKRVIDELSPTPFKISSKVTFDPLAYVDNLFISFLVIIVSFPNLLLR